MQDIQQETLNECTKTEQSALVVLWEIDLTEVGGDRYFFCNEQNEKGEPVTWQGRQYQAYPIQGSVWSAERWSGVRFTPVFWMW